MKCVKCNQEAEFDSPDIYCVYHWAKWWVDGATKELGLTQEQYDEELNLTLDFFKENSII